MKQEYRLAHLTTTSFEAGGKSGGGSPAPSIREWEPRDVFEANFTVRSSPTHYSS